jgi:DNA ligase-associated metallophosphoesterase
MQPVSYNIQEQTMWLSPERCMFWENQQALILCDLHLGKSGHFRKEGIAIPQQILEHDLSRLDAQIEYFLPTSLIVIGDLFHSRHNMEVNYFRRWRKKYNQTAIHLIQGNHDILSAKMYDDLNITLHQEAWDLSAFVFRHESSNGQNKDRYEISGHIHPGIKMKGKGKQSLKFPCFYFADSEALMPAFGKFTGLHIIEPAKTASVFAVAENEIIKI